MKKELIEFTNKEPKTNLSGKIFNYLTLLKPVGRYRRAVVYLCKCECGNEIYIPSTQVKTGSIKSCGCLWKKKHLERITKHGFWGTHTYSIWNKMIQRCINSNFKYYDYYGGRGVKVCEEWLKSFENFYNDMGECPKELTIDRIDNNKGYYRENCRWATRKEQIKNRSNSIYIKYNGEERYLKDWCKILGIKYRTLYNRLYEMNWSVEKAFNTPVNK